jgi:small conductance mechanosensitive channel
VSNETHGWSRATFEIGVAYSEDLNRCIAVLTELAMQLRRDPIFGPMIIEDPTIPAVDQLGESSVVLKFFIKTRPHQQRVVRRELLHRIKCRFDELQIEMPFPQRTIHHRYVDGDMPETRAQMRKSA